ncbi:MAG TPA: tautomerase family protein [Kofleriaceae bacterium]
MARTGSSLTPDDKRVLIERVTRAAAEAEGVPVDEMTWVLIHEIARDGWGERGKPLAAGTSRPIVEIATPVGWTTMARKHEMIQRVATAAAEAAGTDGVHYVIVHEVPDGGWGWEGRQVPRSEYQQFAAPDIASAAPERARS